MFNTLITQTMTIECGQHFEVRLILGSNGIQFSKNRGLFSGLPE